MVDKTRQCSDECDYSRNKPHSVENGVNGLKSILVRYMDTIRFLESSNQKASWGRSQRLLAHHRGWGPFYRNEYGKKEMFTWSQCFIIDSETETCDPGPIRDTSQCNSRRFMTSTDGKIPARQNNEFGLTV
jgi:hypothetical protein